MGQHVCFHGPQVVVAIGGAGCVYPGVYGGYAYQHYPLFGGGRQRQQEGYQAGYVPDWQDQELISQLAAEHNLKGRKDKPFWEEYNIDVALAHQQGKSLKQELLEQQAAFDQAHGGNGQPGPGYNGGPVTATPGNMRTAFNQPTEDWSGTRESALNGSSNPGGNPGNPRPGTNPNLTYQNNPSDDNQPPPPLTPEQQLAKDREDRGNAVFRALNAESDEEYKKSGGIKNITETTFYVQKEEGVNQGHLRASAEKLEGLFDKDGTINKDGEAILGSKLFKLENPTGRHVEIVTTVTAADMPVDAVANFQQNAPAIALLKEGKSVDEAKKLLATIHGADDDTRSLEQVRDSLNVFRKEAGLKNDFAITSTGILSSEASKHEQNERIKDHDTKGQNFGVSTKVHTAFDKLYDDEAKKPADENFIHQLLGANGTVKYNRDNGGFDVNLTPDQLKDPSVKQDLQDFERNAPAIRLAMEGHIEEARKEYDKIHGGDIPVVDGSSGAHKVMHPVQPVVTTVKTSSGPGLSSQGGGASPGTSSQGGGSSPSTSGPALNADSRHQVAEVQIMIATLYNDKAMNGAIKHDINAQNDGIDGKKGREDKDHHHNTADAIKDLFKTSNLGDDGFSTVALNFKQNENALLDQKNKQIDEINKTRDQDHQIDHLQKLDVNSKMDEAAVKAVIIEQEILRSKGMKIDKEAEIKDGMIVNKALVYNENTKTSNGPNIS